ncbi:hypothetical protein V8F33_003556 [Rhypophila sp. PSN 637]
MDYSKPTPAKSGERPCPHTSPLGMYTSKFALRLIQFVLSIAMIGLVGSTMQAGFWALGTLIVSAPATIVSTCWSLSEMICIYVRAGHRGIHPGACVAVDLLLWLAFIGATAMLSFLGIATSAMGLLAYPTSLYLKERDFDSFNRDDSSSGYGSSSSSSSSGYGSSSSSSSSSNYDSYDSLSQTLDGVVAKGQALIGLGATLVILHFATFVIACYETNVRNRKKYAATTTVIYETSNATNHSMVPITHMNTPISTYNNTAVVPIHTV